MNFPASTVLLVCAGMASTAGAQLMVGAGSGSSLISTLSPTASVQTFEAFPGFRGGVRVAAGDLDGDGVADVIATPHGPAAVNGHVKAFKGSTGAELASFFPFDGFSGGISVAAGDVNNDGFADFVAAPDSTQATNGHVKVFDGRDGSLVRSFFAFQGFQGGVNVAAGDVDGDGFSDMAVVAGPGGNGHVKVFSGQTSSELASFFAFPGFQGGVSVAAGDINGDGRADIITGAGAGGGPHVKAFDGVTGDLLLSFFAYTPAFTGGINVAVGDVNSDGLADIITGAGPGGGPHVKVFDGRTGAEQASFFAFAGVSDIEGAFVAAAPIPTPAGALVLGAAGMVTTLRRRRS